MKFFQHRFSNLSEQEKLDVRPIPLMLGKVGTIPVAQHTNEHCALKRNTTTIKVINDTCAFAASYQNVCNEKCLKAPLKQNICRCKYANCWSPDMRGTLSQKRKHCFLFKPRGVNPEQSLYNLPSCHIDWQLR